MRDDAGVFGVDDRRAPWHRHDVVHLQWTQDLKLAPLVGDDDLAIGGPDDVVVVEPAPVGLEAPTAHQDDLVETALGVAHLDAIALGERASAGGLAEAADRIAVISLKCHYAKDSA